jgi:hypothetical protein
MNGNPNCLIATHHVQRGQIHYEVETERSGDGYCTIWTCLACRRSSQKLRTPLQEAGEDQAFGCVDAHHLFFHSLAGASSDQHGWETTKTAPCELVQIPVRPVPDLMNY